MKKTISILLALVLCLSLCACGGGNDTSTETTTEDPAIAAQRKNDYETALRILNSSSDSFIPDPNIQRAYELLSALGDYEQSAEYLSRIGMLPNMLTKMEHYNVNAFGEHILQHQGYYGYTADGKMTCRPGYDSEDHSFYSYNDQGQITEVRVGSARHTYNYENGVLTSVDVLYASGKTEQHIYENGKMIRKIVDGHNGIFTYDENGNLTEEFWEYDGGGTSTATYTYEFDADGNMISKTASWYMGKYTTTTTYTYENGNLVKEDVQDSEGNHYYITYTYGDYYYYDPEV